MRKLHQYVLSAIVVAAASLPLVAQQTIIEIERPFQAQNLAGTVIAEISNGGIAGVTVQECTEKWATVLASTTTDSKGRFAFPSSSGNGLHYLRLSAPGFNIMLIRISIGSSGPKEFSVRIQVAN